MELRAHYTRCACINEEQRGRMTNSGEWILQGGSGVCVCGVWASHPTVRWHYSCPWRLRRSVLGLEALEGRLWEDELWWEGPGLMQWTAGPERHGAPGHFCCPDLWVWLAGLCGGSRQREGEGFAYCSFNFRAALINILMLTIDQKITYSCAEDAS